MRAMEDTFKERLIVSKFCVTTSNSIYICVCNNIK